ncbi:MAG: hypothetical protein B7Y25_08045 [Alphaproteobacteria bacterium 16-39-46]|nr:MAG: hypothetical protein B7Y25_08045 [Alphaproteobacteria bacterium 16-39-46]HQS84828.1 hypothetical protein [Alphaproteobacteria bacterium]HQS94622.1 hypothetical protein [Alphaproteobacteria bacterium]
MALIKTYFRLFLISLTFFIGMIGISKPSLSMTASSLDSLLNAPTVSAGGGISSIQSLYNTNFLRPSSPPTPPTNISPLSPPVSSAGLNATSGGPSGPPAESTASLNSSDAIREITSVHTLVPDITTSAATNQAVQNAVQAATTTPHVPVCTSTLDSYTMQYTTVCT